MKKTLITFTLLVPLMAACSGNKAYNGNDSDSTIISEAEAALDSIDSMPLPALTAQGLGPVRIGMPIDSLPEGVDNLYDHFETDDEFDSSIITFSLQGETMFTVNNFGEGKVDVIALASDKLGFKTNAGMIHLGDPMVKMFKADGVTTEFVSMDDSGEWYWRCNELWICPDPEQCSPELAEALGRRTNPPAASLVGDNVTIGYIGTGLLW